MRKNDNDIYASLHTSNAINQEAMETIIFVSLGMVVLDEIRFADGKILYDVAGGSGLHSTLGARLAVTVSGHLEKVGVLVLAGKDFPDSVEATLRSWGISLELPRDPLRLSTRGLLRYREENFAERTFEYTTQPLQPTPSDLKDTSLLHSSAFHFLATPQLFEDFVSQLTELRHAAGINEWPLLIWEPLPLSCTPANQPAHLQAAKLVDVYSPNHIEFINTFGDMQEERPRSSSFDRIRIETLAQIVFPTGVGHDGSGVAIIRCGEHGSVVICYSRAPQWFPPFHDGASPKVVDATGAGNAFLGGFALSFGENRDLEEAVVAGTVAASFAIEQVGLPERDVVNGEELWNGETFGSRVQRYMERIPSRRTTSV